jgi:ATP-dependent RNA helicase DHX57
VDSVGYVVRGDSALNSRSRLIFCTTGVLLRQLQREAALDCITHIVVDEVHERHLDSDILLGLLKQLLPKYPRLRVILMSATLDADRFAGYWGTSTPRIHIPGRTFPVIDFTLEDVLSLTGYVPRKSKKGTGYSHQSTNFKRSSPWNDSEKSDNAVEGNDEPEQDTIKAERPKNNLSIPIEELVKRVDETSVDYDLLARLVQLLVLDKRPTDDGSILVFLSGAPEIGKAMEAIKRFTKALPILILSLHGGLQAREQNLVLRPAERGITKVILSTNIAETSVTIGDCTIVIDTAREKQSSYDPANRMPLLVEQFASIASLKQRRGRAGRVREGTCYKLISRATLDTLSEHGEPEIRRCALDQSLLSLLFLGVENGAGSFMDTLLDPPSRDSLCAASTSLMQIGAVEAGSCDGELVLTPLGVHIAGIPAPPTVGKSKSTETSFLELPPACSQLFASDATVLVMGSILGCRDAALAMAAGMSLGKSPFLPLNTQKGRMFRGGENGTEEMKQEKVLQERAALFQSVGASDHALLVEVFMRWNETGVGMRRRFCDSLGLSENTMRDISHLAKQLENSLNALGFIPSLESNRNGKSWRIIRACVVSALAPTQLVKVVRPSARYHETAEGAKEMDNRAQELKLFIRTHQNTEERVFIHPSSAHFSSGSYSCPWLVYHSLMRTSKPFLRDVTECDAYPLLLFGGQLQVQASKNVVIIDNWVKLSTNARIGSLMGGLRLKVDLMLSRKVEEPSFEIANTDAMKLIVTLIKTDGLGTK